MVTTSSIIVTPEMQKALLCSRDKLYREVNTLLSSKIRHVFCGKSCEACVSESVRNRIFFQIQQLENFIDSMGWDKRNTKNKSSLV